MSVNFKENKVEKIGVKKQNKTKTKDEKKNIWVSLFSQPAQPHIFILASWYENYSSCQYVLYFTKHTHGKGQWTPLQA